MFLELSYCESNLKESLFVPVHVMRLVMKEREELQTGEGVEGGSRKSDCQTPFHTSSEQEENNRVSVNTRICFLTH